ncbi:BLUF domain-containing protein [Aliivibrio kagoshimensis]|uniref:BLUF domain-containing protein n=1 Tax=Aliivibrio kagoshimensis TaxID=2910230 RepID=UPI003D123AC7
MFLTRLIYVSTATDKVTPDTLDGILISSRKNNKKGYVTGLLSFTHKYYLQCLEGSRAEVNRTFNRILKDEKHTNIVILYYQEINEREFGDWSMGNIPQSNLTGLLKLQFGGSDEFRPYEMSGESAYRMLLTLKQSLPSE